MSLLRTLLVSFWMAALPLKSVTAQSQFLAQEWTITYSNGTFTSFVSFRNLNSSFSNSTTSPEVVLQRIPLRSSASHPLPINVLHGTIPDSVVSSLCQPAAVAAGSNSPMSIALGELGDAYNVVRAPIAALPTPVTALLSTSLDNGTRLAALQSLLGNVTDSFLLSGAALTSAPARSSASTVYNISVNGSAVWWSADPFERPLGVLWYAHDGLSAAASVVCQPSWLGVPLVVHYSSGVVAGALSCAPTSTAPIDFTGSSYVISTRNSSVGAAVVTTVTRYVGVNGSNTSNNTSWTLSEGECRALLALGLVHSAAVVKTQELNTVVIDTNELRRTRARRVSSVMYFVIALVLDSIAVAFAVYLGWFFQPYVPILVRIAPKFFKGDPKTSLRVITANSVIHAFFLILLISGVTAGGGFPAWNVVAVVLILSFVIIVVVYLVYRWRKVVQFKLKLQREEIQMRTLKPAGEAELGVSTSLPDPNEDADSEQLIQDLSPAEAALARMDPPHPIFSACDPTVHSLRSSAAVCPLPLGHSQIRVCCCGMIAALYLVIVLLYIWYSWTVLDFAVVDRFGNGTAGGEVLYEVQGPNTARSLQLLYSWDRLASNMRLQLYTSFFTQWCGTSFTKPFKSNSEKKKALVDEFIDLMHIDMSMFARPSYLNYTSPNDWFTRRLDMNTVFRHHPPSVSPNAIQSPADARTTIFDILDLGFKYWLKGAQFSPQEMLDEPLLNKSYDDGHLVISRLAPMDYHRFHSPARVRLVQYRTIPGTYWSVGGDAVRSRNYIFLNFRQIAVLDALDVNGVVFERFYYAAIGATCTGSVLLYKLVNGVEEYIREGNASQIGTEWAAGEEIGLMQFGGSTIVMVLRGASVNWDPDITFANSMSVEHHIRVGQRMGLWTRLNSSGHCVTECG